MSDRPYSRIYWSVMDDAKFDGIRENVRHLGSWCLLLIVADMAHPAPAFIPANVPRSSFAALTECGLVDALSGGRFRIHGLNAERSRRSEAARVGGLASGRSRAVEHSLNGRSTKTNLDETRQDKTSITRARRNTVDADPLYREQREAIKRTYGEGA